MSRSTIVRSATCVASIVVLTACGGGGGDGGPTNPGGTVASVSISPPTSSLVPQQTVQLTATVRDAAGATLTGKTVSWSSSAPDKATVSGGLVTAVAAGSATITATSDGKSGTAQVTVTAPVNSVELSAATNTLVPQQTLQLTTTLKDAGGVVLTGRAVTYSSSATSVATVSTTGLVTAVALGSATITAASEGKSGTIDVSVVTGALIGPSGGTVTAGNGTITVTVPPGALPTGTPISLTPIQAPTSPPPSKVRFNGSAFLIGPPGVTFSQPVTIKMKYDVTTMPTVAMSGDLRVFMSNGAQWVELANATADVTAGTISGTTTTIGSSITRFGRNAGGANYVSGARLAGRGSGDGGQAAIAMPQTPPPNVTAGVIPPQVTLNPASGSVNFQQRSASFTAILVPAGVGIPLPQPSQNPTPQWKYRWRTTGQHGQMGSVGPNQNPPWTDSMNEQYISTDPNLNQLQGHLDMVYVDVLLNPQETDQTKQIFVTAQAPVDADLQTTYEISPEFKDVPAGQQQNFQLVIRDKQGNILQLQPNFRIKWPTTGIQFGTLAGGNQQVATYTAGQPGSFGAPPPRVDIINVEVEALSFIEHREGHWTYLPPPPVYTVDKTFTEQRDLKGNAKAYATVKVNYQVTVTPSSSTIAAGGTKQLQVSVQPNDIPAANLAYKYTRTGSQGTLSVANGTQTTSNQVTYTAKGLATGGTDQIAVDVISVLPGVTNLETIGTGNASVQVDLARALFSIFTMPTPAHPEGFIAARITVTKVAGATKYEVTATVQGVPYSKTITGAESADPQSIGQAIDGGSVWHVNLEAGFASTQIGVDGRKQVYNNKYGGVVFTVKALP